MGSLGAERNSRLVNALPSVNSNTVIALDPSGVVPETIVPPVPTAAGAVVPPVTVLPSAAFDPFSAFTAPGASGRMRMSSLISRVSVWLVNTVAIPGGPWGFGTGGGAGGG